MFQRKEWDNSRYPRSNKENEDSDHIMTCPCKDAREKFDDTILELCKKMECIKTCPAITEIITMTLFDGKDRSFYAQVVEGQREIANKYYTLIRKAAVEQDTIG